MPITSRKILKAISSIDGSFSRESLIRQLSPGAVSGKNKKKRKKKSSAFISKRDISAVDDLLRKLLYEGYLKKMRKGYSRIRSLTAEGTIAINSSGNAVMFTDDEGQIIIPRENTGSAHNNDRVTAELTDYRNGHFVGTVSGIKGRHRDLFIARFIRKGRGITHLKLLDVPYAVEVCTDDDIDLHPGDIVLARLMQGNCAGSPRCAVVSEYSRDDETVDMERIILKHSLPEPHADYPELKDIHDIAISSVKARKDYRELFTVTIDGESAKDFDDAISLVKEGNTLVLFVHIADVSAYVKKGGDIDREASKRGTSYYLGYHVIPMLPELLSNELCSLKEGVDRLTLTAEITLDDKGNTINHRFFRGIIKVDHRLTYDYADTLIDSGQDTILHKTLRSMKEASDILYEKRVREGSIELNLSDHILIFNGTDIEDIRFARRLRSHRIIEEFMLLANVTVSRELRMNEIPSLYRNHENISNESFQALLKFFRQINIRTNAKGTTTSVLQEIFRQVSGKEHEQVINLVVLKSMMQAYYGISPLGHFGLGFPDYTHFTSPIRRYPDLIVHRCLKGLLDNEPPPYSTDQLATIGEVSSKMERVALSAERDLTRIKSCRLMLNRIGESFNCIISGIARSGFFVALTEMPVEGMVPLRYLTDDYYLIMEDQFTVTGKRFGRRFRIGDRITARLAGVNLDLMLIDFEVVQ